MLPHHYMDVRVGPGDRSIAYFSRKPKPKLVLFVHGFTGHAVNTWARMHELLPAEDLVAQCDIVFYGYESTRSRAQLSADILRQFIVDMNDARGAFQSKIPSTRLQQFTNRPYSKITIIAHSLGAALVRRAILDAMKSKSNESWLRKTRLVLFAPAHRGAYLARLAWEAKGSLAILSVLAAGTKLAIPVLEDLQPTSAFVVDLERETIAACGESPKPPLTAESVVFGLLDKVVEPKPFCSDPMSNVWPGHGHLSVCKVSADFKEPLAEVLRHI